MVKSVDAAVKNNSRAETFKSMCGPRTERQANARGYYWVKMVFDGAVIRALRRSSPGAMEHSIDGLSANVFNERLRKLTRYGLLDKRSFAEMPPRVEHHLTPLGVKLGGIIEQIENLETN